MTEPLGSSVASVESKATKMNFRGSVISIYVLSLLLSACSLLYELLIAQTLTMIAGNVVIWYSLTAGTYLAAMGAGAIFCGKCRAFRGWKSLFHVELILSFLGGFAVVLLEFAHTLYIMNSPAGYMTSVFGPGTMLFFGFAFLITFAIGMLTGMELPLLIDLGHQLAMPRNVTNRVLGWDYMGALVGGLVFPLYLVARFQLHSIGFFIAGLNLTVAVCILVLYLAELPRVTAKIIACTALGAVFIMGCSKGDSIEQFFLKKYYYYNSLETGSGALFDTMRHRPNIYRRNSPYQKIDLVYFPDYKDDLITTYSTKFLSNALIKPHYALFLNGDFQFFSYEEEFYHEWLAHIPVIMNGKVPKRVLVVGAGDGLLQRELLKYKDIESITHVDIDHNLVTLARTHPLLTAINQHALDDPRVHTIFEDAFQYLRHAKGEQFDAIYMDFPNVIDYNLSKLYSREFFYFAKMRLKDNGYIALDAPNVYYDTSDVRPSSLGDWSILSNTARLAGFKTVLPFYLIVESDNPKIHRRLVEQGIRDKKAYMSDYLDDMQEGFMVLRKDERYGPFKYIDFGIKLYVLDAKRFQLSYPGVHKPTGDIDHNKVNSILRPTLPHGMIWHIRNLL